MADLESKLSVGIDKSDADRGLRDLGNTVENLGRRVKAAGEQGGAGLSKMGEGGDQAAQRVDRATRSMQQSIERTIARLEAGQAGTRKFYESMGQMRGVDANALKPYLDRLDQVQAKHAGVGSGAEKLSFDLNRLGGYFMAAAAAVAAYVTVDAARAILEQADAVSLLNSRLKLSTSSAQEFAAAQKGLFQLAQSNSVGLSETITLYTRLADPVKRLGGGMTEVIGITNAFQKALQLGGVSAQEAASATLQFGQALGAGALAGDEFRSLAEASPRLLKAIADGAGLPIEQLKKLGSEGKLTADVVSNALLKMSDQLSAEFEQMPDTVGKAMTRLKNEVTRAIGEMNDNTGLTLGAAAMVDEFAKLVPVVYDELGGAVQAVGAWLQENRDWIISTVEAAKGLIADVWNIGKAAASVVGAIAEWVGQTNIVAAAITIVRGLIAAVYDGVRALAGAFSYVGSVILQTVLAPVQAVIRGLAAASQLIGKSDWAASFKGAADSMHNFAAAGAKAGAQVFDDFKRGDSALQRLRTSLSGTAADVVKVGTASGGIGGFGLLKRNADDAGKSAKGAAKAAKQAKDEFAELFNRLTAKDAGLDAKFFEQLNILYAGYQKGRIGIDKYREAVENLINSQQFAKDAAKQLADAQRQAAEDMRRAEDATTKQFDSLSNMLEGLEFEISLLKLSNQEREVAIKLRELEKLGLVEGTDAWNAYADAIKDALGRKGAIEASIEANKRIEDEWNRTVDQMGQSLTDALLRGFEDGKGFAKNFRDTLVNMFKTLVLRPVIEAVIRPIGVGLTGMLGGGAAMAQGGGGFGGVGSLLNAGSSLLGGSFGSFLGLGNIGAGFGAGWGALLGGNIGGGLSAGLTALTAGNIGGGLGTLAGVAAPILAPLALLGLSGAFSRKHEQHNLQGVFGGETGFEGQWHDYYRGGLLRSSKTVNTPLQADFLKGLRDAWKASEAAVTSYAQTLGLSTDAIAGFTHAVNIKLKDLDPKASDYQQQVMARVQEAIRSGSNEMAQLLIGTWQSTEEIIRRQVRAYGDELGGWTEVEESVTRQAYVQSEYAREGEQAIDTLTRLATSLQTVRGAFDVLGGAMLQASLAGGDLASRLVDSFGGAENFGAVTNQYWQDYYSDEERAATIRRQIETQLTAVGVAMPDSRAALRSLAEQYQAAMIAGDESAMRAYTAIMRVAAAFAEITPAAESAAEAAARLAEEARKMAEEAYSGARSHTDEVWQRLQSLFGEQLDHWRQIADVARGIFSAAGEAKRSLRGEMADTRAWDAAQGQLFIDDALRAALTTGVLPDQAAFSQAIDAARAGLDASGYASVAQFEVDKAILAAKLGAMEEVAGTQLTAAEQQIQLLQDQQDTLRKQLETLRGMDLNIGSIAEGVAMFVAAMEAERAAKDALDAATGTGAGGGASFGGGSGSFGGAARTAEQIAAEAKALQGQDWWGSGDWHRLSGARLDAAAAAIGATPEDLEQYLKDRGLQVGSGGVIIPRFAAGGLHAGGLRLVGERGPELEVTGPARIFNADQTRALLGGNNNAEVVAELRAVKAELAEMRRQITYQTDNSDRQLSITQRLTDNGTAMKIQAVAV